MPLDHRNYVSNKKRTKKKKRKKHLYRLKNTNLFLRKENQTPKSYLIHVIHHKRIGRQKNKKHGITRRLLRIRRTGRGLQTSLKSFCAGRLVARSRYYSNKDHNYVSSTQVDSISLSANEANLENVYPDSSSDSSGFHSDSSDDLNTVENVPTSKQLPSLSFHHEDDSVEPDSTVPDEEFEESKQKTEKKTKFCLDNCGNKNCEDNNEALAVLLEPNKKQIETKNLIENEVTEDPTRFYNDGNQLSRIILVKGPVDEIRNNQVLPDSTTPDRSLLKLVRFVSCEHLRNFGCSRMRLKGSKKGKNLKKKYIQLTKNEKNIQSSSRKYTYECAKQLEENLLRKAQEFEALRDSRKRANFLSQTKNKFYLTNIFKKEKKLNILLSEEEKNHKKSKS